MHPRSIYDAHVGYVWSSLRGLGIPLADLDDATQEVFLRLFRRIQAVDFRRSIRPWLFGICRNVAHHHRRSIAVRYRLGHLVGGPVLETNGVDAIEQHDAMKLIDACLAKLPAAQREVFVLAELQQCTRDEIAKTLGISPNTVGSRLRLGRVGFTRELQRIRALDQRADLLETARRTSQPDAAQRAHAWGAIALALPTRAWPLAWLGSIPWSGASVGVSVGAVALAGVVGFGLGDAPTNVGTTYPPAGGHDTEEHRLKPAAVPSSPARDELLTVRSATPLIPPDTALARTPPSIAAVRRTKVPRPRSTDEGTAADPLGESSLATEANLVKGAHAAVLAGQPSEALALCSAYARNFPQGTFAFECAQIEIKILCKEGRRDAANASLQAWRGRDPSARNMLEVLQSYCDPQPSDQEG